MKKNPITQQILKLAHYRNYVNAESVTAIARCFKVDSARMARDLHAYRQGLGLKAEPWRHAQEKLTGKYQGDNWISKGRQ